MVTWNMPKRRKKAADTEHLSKKTYTTSRDSDNQSNDSLLEQNSSGYEVTWDDKSPAGVQTRGPSILIAEPSLATSHIGQDIVKAFQGKVGATQQRREEHELMQLLKSNLQSEELAGARNTSSKLRWAGSFTDACQQLRDIAKKLDYYDERDKVSSSCYAMNNESVYQEQPKPAMVDHRGSHSSLVLGSSSGLSGDLTSGGDLKLGGDLTLDDLPGGHMATDSSDTESINYDSSPDHQLHCVGRSCTDQQHIVGVARNKCVQADHRGSSACTQSDHGKGMARNQYTQTDRGRGVALSACTRTDHKVTAQDINVDRNHCPLLGKTWLPTDDSDDLDQLFADVSNSMVHNADIGESDDEEFWSSAAQELAGQEMASTPRQQDFPPTDDFVDMLLTGSDMDSILNQY